MRDDGIKQKDIAKILKFNKSAISREINKRKRKNGYYDADTAQHKADNGRRRSKYQGKKIEQNEELKAYIVTGLKKHRSPDEISGRMKEENQPFYAGKDAIYSWLYSVWGERYCKHLCTKRHKKKKYEKKKKREMIPDRIPLDQRPEQGQHGETDLFVSSKKSETSRSGALTCVPSAKLLVGAMIPNRKPKTMSNAVREMIGSLSIDDLTLDNGIENKDHKNFGLPAFFADPYSPWQKPHVENNIGLLRRWCIPKKTDLCDISENHLQQCLHFLNRKYRKSLGYKNAYEVALDRGIIRNIPDKEIDYTKIIRKIKRRVKNYS